MGLIHNDPLYFFTAQSVHSLVISFLHNILRPLLSYSQEVYGPPVGLDGLTTVFSVRTGREQVTVSAPNFQYEELRPVPFRSTTAHQLVSAIIKSPSSIANGYSCTLVVWVPKSYHHSFWHRKPSIISHPLTMAADEFGW